jgi:hypothetical protein
MVLSKNKIVVTYYNVSKIAYAYITHKVLHVHTMKALEGGKWLTLCSSCFTLRKNAPRAGLDVLENGKISCP